VTGRTMTAETSKSARSAVEEALRSPDIPSLANNEIGRLLGVSGHCVGECRRLLEAHGEIESVYRRLGRRGCVDVRRIGPGRRGDNE
jgi:hypothetical protein